MVFELVLEYETTWNKLWGKTGLACAHGIHCLNRQEVLLATQELRNKGPGFVGAELHFVPTVALCCHNVKLCSLAGIPAQRSHLKTSHRNVFISIYRKGKYVTWWNEFVETVRKVTFLPSSYSSEMIPSSEECRGLRPGEIHESSMMSFNT